MTGSINIVVKLRRRGNSKNYYIDLNVPIDVWRRRSDLIAMGFKIRKNQQFAVSTRTSDQPEAERIALQLELQHRENIQRWRDALTNNGPVEIDEEEASRIAANYFTDFFRKHQRNPRKIAQPKYLIDNASNHRDTRRIFKELMSATSARSYAAELLGDDFLTVRRFLRKDAETSTDHSIRDLATILLATLNRGEKVKAWINAPDVLDTYGYADTINNRKLIERELLEYREISLLELESRAFDKRLEEPAWLNQHPLPKSSTATTESHAKPHKLLDLLEHKFSHHKNKRTVRTYRKWINSFVEFSGKSLAHDVGKADVRNWRDSLQSQYSPKTVNGKALAALGSVLEHAVREFDLTINVSKGIRDSRKPTGNQPKGYSDQQAKAILVATRKPIKANVQHCYKNAIRWVPWIAAYTGLRATEITKLFAEDFIEENGNHFIRIRQDRGRTKTDRDWTTGVHPALIDEGLLRFVEQAHSGPLFYKPYGPDVELGQLQHHRAEDAAKRVSNWVRGEVKMTDKSLSPTHAWRHRFTTEARRVGVEEAMIEYLEGSRPTSSKKSDYGEYPLEAINRAIRSIGKVKC